MMLFYLEMNNQYIKFNIEDYFKEKDFSRFDLSLPNLLLGSNVVFTLYGRNALFLGMQSIYNLNISKREVLVPSYCCGDEIEAIIRAGFTVVPYLIDKDLNISTEEFEDKINNNTVAILVIHYFGFPQSNIEDIKKMCDKYNIFLVEDCAHSCNTEFNGTPLGSWGDISIFSLRKCFDIPHGGAVVLNNKKLKIPEVLNPSTEVVTLDMINFLNFKIGKNKYGTPIVDQLKLTTGSDIYGPRHDKYGGYSLGLSNLAKFMLKQTDVVESSSVRKINFLKFSNLFSKEPNRDVVPLFKEINNDITPLFFPLIINRDSEDVYFDLMKKGLDILRPFWSKFHYSINYKLFPESSFLKNRLMVLPLDVNVSEDQVIKLLKNL
ncbi:MAG TPA: DegT/DnrJ/EryC1/StrS family aminotransferase [Candidatus Paceibacterota bacterium]